MTKEEAKEIIESECYVFNPLNFDRTTRINTALDVAVEALEQTSPCDLCQYNPPSSGDGKPCIMCPACSGGDEE